MLDALRANKRGIITWAIVSGIVIIFAINFGPGSFSKRRGGDISGGTAQYAARVNGEIIGAQEYEKQLARMYDVYRAQSGGQLTRELAVQLGLPNQALDMLIERKVVVQEAKRRGIRVPDEEVRGEVAQNQAFFVNGQFDREAYRDIARQNFGSETRFEEAIRDDLLYRHMLSSVAQTVKVPEAEARRAWEVAQDKASLRYVIFPRSALEAAVKPGAAEVKELAAKDPARIQAFYEANKARFEQQRRVKVRHVLARVEPGADDAAARKRIEEAKARVAKGEDFGAVAAALSDDENTRTRGGDLGFVAEGLYDPAFAAAALALEKGQVSEPVRSQSGWHLLRADEVVPAKSTSLEQAIPEIARELLVKDRAAKAGAERAAAALAAARKAKEPGKALAGFVAKVGDREIGPEETGVFEASGEVVPKLGIVKELLADTLAADAGALLPRVYETAAGPVIAEVISRERPDPAAWDKAKGAAMERLRAQKEYAVVQAWVKSLRDGSKVNVNDGYMAQVLPGQR
jgi:peptidyl-prolyl cis-trans isomerase D